MKKESQQESSVIFTKRSGGEKVLFGIVLGIFILYAISLLLPFVWVLINSFQKATTYSYNIGQGKPFALPEEWRFSNYAFALTKMIYKDTNLIGMFLNSMWQVILGAGLNIFFQAVTGYCFAKFDFKAKPTMMAVAIFCLTVPIVGTTGAQYQVYIALGLFDSPLQIILTSMGGFGGNFLIMLAIFKNISWSYAEAVFIDGGNQYTAFFKIMLPQAMPAMITLFITGAIARWNDYLSVLMFMPSFPTLATGLYMISTSLVRYGGATYYYAGLVISTIPILIVFALFSESMMKNLSMGGLKG